MTAPTSVRFHRNSTYGSVGCTVGVAPHLYVGAYGEDAADALSRAGALAAELQDLMDQNKEVAAALQAVPYLGTALRAVSAAAALYKSGASAKQVTAAVGPTAASVVRKILAVF